MPQEIPMTDYRVSPGQAQEDQVTAAIESYTAQVPSTVYLGCAIASIAASVTFKLAKKDNAAVFVGQWVAPFLLLGIYNKLVKQHGSDAGATNV
jgi:D-serine dehydratase